MGEVALIQNHALAYTPKQYDLIRRTVAADCNPVEFDLFCEVARRVGLDPFRKQIYAVVYSKDNPDRRKMSIITGIDGYRAVAARNRDYRPDDEAPVIEYDESLKSEANPVGIVSATVKCWKLAPDGKWHQVAGCAYWDEFAPIKEVAEGYDWVDTGETWADSGKAKKKKVPRGDIHLEVDGKWKTMPRIMIAKTAEAQALRRGWPEDLSGIYTEDEMARATVQDMSASEAADTFEKQKRLEATGGRDSIFIMWNSADPMENVPVGQFADRAAAYIKAIDNLPDLHGWRDTNRVALQDFWARSKSDALELKKIIEARESQIIEASKAA